MGLKVNFSQEEAESKAREIPPTGTYSCSIVDISMKEVNPGSPNVGKPYWNIRFVIQDGRYEGSSLFSNIMLFETDKSGTLSSLSQFLKALGYTITPGEFEIPDEDEIQGKQIIVIGRKVPAGTDKHGKSFPEQFRVSGYKKLDGVSAKATSTSSSLLP